MGERGNTGDESLYLAPFIHGGIIYMTSKAGALLLQYHSNCVNKNLM